MNIIKRDQVAPLLMSKSQLVVYSCPSVTLIKRRRVIHQQIIAKRWLLSRLVTIRNILALYLIVMTISSIPSDLGVMILFVTVAIGFLVCALTLQNGIHSHSVHSNSPDTPFYCFRITDQHLREGYTSGHIPVYESFGYEAYWNAVHEEVSEEKALMVKIHLEPDTERRWATAVEYEDDRKELVKELIDSLPRLSNEQPIGENRERILAALETLSPRREGMYNVGAQVNRMVLENISDCGSFDCQGMAWSIRMLRESRSPRAVKTLLALLDFGPSSGTDHATSEQNVADAAMAALQDIMGDSPESQRQHVGKTATQSSWPTVRNSGFDLLSSSSLCAATS